MMSKSSLALTVVLCSVLGASAPRADQPQCYTLASLDGSWTIISTFGATVARTIPPGTQTGTYAVNCDGTGTVTRVVTASNGTTASQTDDFVITAAEVRHHELIATAAIDVQRVPSALVPGGIFVVREM